MGRSATCDDSVSEVVGCRNSLSCSPNCEESCVKHEQCNFNNTENIKKALFLGDLEASSASEEDDDDSDHLMVQELGVSHGEILHFHETLEPLCIDNLVSIQEDSSMQREMQSLSLDTDMLKDSSKYAMNLRSKLVQIHPLVIDAGEELSYKTLHGRNLSEAETFFKHNLPATTLKLIPALKGSRIRQGMPPSIKLSVKWAPEVYDPPVTSSSHTVKDPHRHRRHHHHHHHNHQHHRSKEKDHQKNKYAKGKPSKGSVGERKHAHRRSSTSSLIDPRISRSHAPGGGNTPTQNSCSRSKAGILDYAVSRVEPINCASRCYMESPVPVQLSVAKAS